MTVLLALVVIVQTLALAFSVVVNVTLTRRIRTIGRIVKEEVDGLITESIRSGIKIGHDNPHRDSEELVAEARDLIELQSAARVWEEGK